MKVACLSHKRKQKYDFSESLYCPFKGNNIFSVSISHLSLGISGDWMQRLAPNPAWSRVQDEIILGVYCIRWLCSSKWKIDLNLCIYSSGRRNMGDDLSLFNSNDQNNRLKKKIAFILCWARCLESGHLSSGTETGVCNVGWGFCSLTILWLPQGRTFSSHPLSADCCTLKTGLSSVPAMVRLDLPVSGLIKVFRKRRRRNLSGHIKAAACKTKMRRCHWGSY